MFFEMAINVFDHHDRRINHHADAYGEAAQRSKIGRKPRIPHEYESDEHTKWYCGSGDERAAKVSQQ